MLFCANGKHITKAVLTGRKAGETPQDYVKWTFSDILVSSFTTSGTGAGDELPMESISLNYTKIEVEYKEQKPDGSLAAGVRSGWDLKKQEKF
jgi:type VI secretion system secreted protein Hcp